MNKDSIYIKLTTQTLHLQRFNLTESGEPILMIHGSIENGQIFYSSSGKGLAPYLAKMGYDVFVADLRGKGKSSPQINSKSEYGISETIHEDIAAYLKKINDIKGNMPVHCIAHSMGGVLLLAYYARYHHQANIASMVFFGTKRRLSVGGLKRLFMIDIMWGFVSKAIIKLNGYLPAKSLKMGSDNESARTYYETDVWVKSNVWLDWHDKFDYAKALQNLVLPPILYLTGIKDEILGNPVDVKLLAQETGQKNNKVIILGKKNGNKHDYGHIDILIHKDAETDHFPMVIDWMQQHSANHSKTKR